MQKGEPLLTIHANAEEQLSEAQEQLLSAYSWSEAPAQAPPLIRGIIR